MMKRLLLLMIAITVGSVGHAGAQTEPPQAWTAPALEVVSFFEGASWNTVTEDFDCNGASVGTLQWNVRSGNLRRLLSGFSADTIAHFMPTYGQELLNRVNISPKAGVAYVRKFQTFKNPGVCKNANARGAKWMATKEAKTFVGELSSLLSSEEGRKIQLQLAAESAREAWRLATEWSIATRGNTSATYTEFLFFYDTINFSGTKWELSVRYQEVAKLKLQGDQVAYDEATHYLATERSFTYLQTKAADKDAALWKNKNWTQEQLNLFLHAYLLAKWITKPSAIQFRLNVISRRGVIVFKDGVINKWPIPASILKDLETPP